MNLHRRFILARESRYTSAYSRYAVSVCIGLGLAVWVTGRMAGQSVGVESPCSNQGDNCAASQPSVRTSSLRSMMSAPSPYIDDAGGGGLGSMPSAHSTQTGPKPEPLTDLQRLAVADFGETLEVFGSRFFHDPPSTFAPVGDATIGPDYVIGPGDEVLLRLWGRTSLNDHLTVDRSGAIYVPLAGSIHVAGLRFDEMQRLLQSELSLVYRNFAMSVNLGKLRSIQVEVFGEAAHPGTYTVSSLTTLPNLLFQVGGPSPQGSMRHIHLRRGGHEILDYDLYHLLVEGERSADLRLQSGDLVFFDIIGQQVALGGHVHRPAIYELRGETTFADIIAISGGMSPSAALDNIMLDRISEHTASRAMTLSMRDGGGKTLLQDGDVLYVGTVSPAFDRTVTIRGNLANPGRFPWHPGMKLSDLLPERAALITRNYWAARNQLGLPESAAGSTGAGSPTRTTLPSATEQGLANSTLADQQQAVRKYSLAGSVSTDVSHPAPEIDWSYAVVERLNPETLRTSLIPFNLGQLVEQHDQTQDMSLNPGDIVTIFSQNDIHVSQNEQPKYIRLEGEFGASGIYSVMPGETLRDVVRRAGGLTSLAYLFGASFSRESTRVFQQQRLDEYVSQLSLDFEKTTSLRAASSPASTNTQLSLASQSSFLQQLHKLRATGRIVLEFKPDTSGLESIPALPLEDGDIFRVPSVPIAVNVVGAVYGQNVLLYDQNRKLADYIALAGKLKRDADRKHIFLIRADGAVVSLSSGHLPPISPGDTIVIPEKLPKASPLRDVIDYSTLFSQFAIGSAAISVLR